MYIVHALSFTSFRVFTYYIIHVLCWSLYSMCSVYVQLYTRNVIVYGAYILMNYIATCSSRGPVPLQYIFIESKRRFCERHHYNTPYELRTIHADEICIYLYTSKAPIYTYVYDMVYANYECVRAHDISLVFFCAQTRII